MAVEDTLTKFPYETEEEYDQIVADNEDNILVVMNDTSEGKYVIFSDNARVKYIQSLEDQILLLADELSGGIL